MNFGVQLKKKRREMAMSQTDFAEMLGISATTLCKYERGKYAPSLVVADEFAKKLDMPLPELLGDESYITMMNIIETFYHLCRATGEKIKAIDDKNIERILREAENG